MFDVKSIIGAVIVVIVIIAVALPVTIGTVTQVTNPTQVVNETVALTNNSYITLANYPIDLTLAARPVINNSQYNNTLIEGAAPAGNYTLLAGTNSGNKNGTIFLENVNVSRFDKTGSAGFVTYAYQQQGYDSSTIDRTVLKILPIALPVMLLVIIFMMVATVLG